MFVVVVVVGGEEVAVTVMIIATFTARRLASPEKPLSLAARRWGGGRRGCVRETPLRYYVDHVIYTKKRCGWRVRLFGMEISKLHPTNSRIA